MDGRRIRLVARIAIASTWLLAVLPARAGMDVDFGTAVNFGSDTDLFLRISSRYFDRDRPVVDSWARHFANPDDTAIFFFLSRHSGKSPDAIWAMRQQGNTWFEIGLRVGVPVDAWFVSLDGAPLPPFEKAYGRYNKHKKQRAKRMSLTDADCRNLISVRILNEYYGLSAQAAMALRASGDDVRFLLCAQYVDRHGKGMSASKARPRRVRNDDQSHRDGKSSRHQH